ncbi:MAG: ArdC family protein, partial [Burkholderiaceae bacterium]|nr:ArdC family protein [Burkholderiaceae bacterium]
AALAERLVQQAAQGVAPWDKVVDPSRGERLPYTPFSKADTHDATRGINGLQLASAAQAKGYKDPRWISSSQLQSLGWRSRFGEEGVNLEFYNPAGTERLQYQRDEQGNDLYDDNGYRISEKVLLLKPAVTAAHMYNMEQVVEGKQAKTPIPELDTAPREPAWPELHEAFAKSGIEIQNAKEDAPSHLTTRGKGTIYLSEAARLSDIAKAQLMVRGMAAKALNLDTAGGWSQLDSDRTKNIKTQLRVEMATRILSDKYAIPTRPWQLNQLREHVAEVLNTVNEKTGEKDQIRFVARDAERAVTRVFKGNWERAKEKSQEQQGQEQPQQQEQQQPERAQQRPEQQQQPEPAPQAKATPKSHKRNRALERA